MAKIRTCMVDRKQYTYCPKCGKDNPNETWRFLFCSDNCRQIYHVVEDYKKEKISISEANSKLNNFSITDKENLGEYIIAPLTEILNYNPTSVYKSSKKNRKNKNNTDITDTVIPVEEIVNDIITEENKIESLDIPTETDSVTDDIFGSIF